MVKGILGKKLGMSQVYNDKGESIPVTLIQAGPCYVIQKKFVDRDGYNAIQLGFDPKKEKRVNKPVKGHQGRAGAGYFYYMREVPCEDVAAIEVGQEIKVDALFTPGEKINVTGKSKGKGFAGVTKRHGFGGLPGSHGSLILRETGSIGSATDPGEVQKGKKMAGHLGDERVTVGNLEVIRILPDENLIAIKGAVPGARGGLVLLMKKQGV
jgi:large subunit ribosomal protein L3